MQQKIIIDTNIYIDIFNSGLHEKLNNPFRYVVFLTHPVLHDYNDISIAMFARQIGAAVVTRNVKDFETIRNFINFDFMAP